MAEFFWNGSLIATLAYFASVNCPTCGAIPAPHWNRKTHPAARNLRFQRGAGIASKVGQYTEVKWANVAIRAPFQKNLANVMRNVDTELANISAPDVHLGAGGQIGGTTRGRRRGRPAYSF